MDMMKDLQNNMNRVDTKTNIMDAGNQKYLSAITAKSKEHVKTSVDDAFGKYEKDMKKKHEETAVKEALGTKTYKSEKRRQNKSGNR